jgi:hypothetical protein
MTGESLHLCGNNYLKPFLGCLLLLLLASIAGEASAELRRLRGQRYTGGLDAQAECGAAAAACGCHRVRIICCALAAVVGACARARVIVEEADAAFTALAAPQGGATMV